MGRPRARRDEPRAAGPARGTAAGEGDGLPRIGRRLGVVLCGGRSRRMGRDKARLGLGGETLLELAVRALEGVAPRVLLACGAESRYGELGHEFVLDARPDGGPLLGLEAALAKLNDELGGADPRAAALLALACDMPRARPEVFERLLEALEREDADLCLVATEEGVEPLYAVYRASVLGAVRAALARGARRLVSFHDGLRVALLHERDLAGGLAADDVARNLNTPEDYRAERDA